MEVVYQKLANVGFVIDDSFIYFDGTDNGTVSFVTGEVELGKDLQLMPCSFGFS